jgi:hypothetical protein
MYISRTKVKLYIHLYTFAYYKIADSMSTIDLILIKGQILDNPKNKDYNQEKVYCPIPPYLNFNKLLHS